MSYIPTYVSINDSGTTTGEVYLASPNAGDLLSYDDNAFNLNGIQYMTNDSDCGTHLIDSRNPGWGERTRNCLDNDIPIYFMRIR